MSYNDVEKWIIKYDPFRTMPIQLKIGGLGWFDSPKPISENSTQYKIAIRFGLVQENETNVKFLFEK